MRSAALTLLFALSLAGAIASLFEFRAVFVESGIQSVKKGKLENSINPLQSELSPEAERQREIAYLESISDTLFTDTRPLLRLARVYQGEAIASNDPNIKIKSYCQALSALGRALKREPISAKLLVNWANLRQLLGPVECKEQYTSGDVHAALDAALNQEPFNASVQFSAGLVHLWSGERDKAISCFSQVLAFGMDVDSGQEQAILSSVDSADEVLKLVPGRFPQIVRWTELLSDERRGPIPNINEALSKLQIRALELDSADYSSSSIPPRLHISRLFALLPLAATEEVRQRIDGEIAAFYRNDPSNPIARYFGERSQKKELGIVRAYLTSDTRPLKTSLTRWNRDERVVFDGFYETVGFYLPSSQTIDFIQVASDQEGASLPPTAIKVFSGDDNQSWTERFDTVKLESLSIQGKPLLVIRLSSGDYHKYWKIQFASNARTRRYTNTLSQLVQAYGVSRIR